MIASEPVQFGPCLGSLRAVARFLSALNRARFGDDIELLRNTSKGTGERRIQTLKETLIRQEFSGAGCPPRFSKLALIPLNRAYPDREYPLNHPSIRGVKYLSGIYRAALSVGYGC